MKRIIFFTFMIPALMFGQEVSNIQINKSIEIISAPKVILPEISNPYEIKKTRCEFKWTCSTVISSCPPLVIVDDIPYELENLNPSKIESISILKGEEAIAMFGSKGENGVILITTKGLKPEYEATVLDTGFESFLATQQPKNYYSETTLKNRNIRMVGEWNSRHLQSTQYNLTIYETNIDYNLQTNYGIDVEYTLYMFFKFMEKKHNIKLS